MTKYKKSITKQNNFSLNKSEGINNKLIKAEINNENNNKNYSTNIECSFTEIEPYLKSITDYENYIKVKNPKFYQEFILEEVLSKGSFGVLLRGKSKKFKKNFAFKLIFNKNVINQKREKCLQKIKNEISIQHKLKSKYINPFYGFYEVADSFLYVLEYERYGDLSNFLRMLRRPVISETLTAFISVQILKGIDYCHKNKIAHLDIKKQNILVDENLNFKLCDFSVSTEYRNNNIKLHAVGSSLYISPENLNRELISNNQINKVDIYSFGVLVYNMVYKSYPYNLTLEDANNLKNFDKIYNKIISEELIIPEKQNNSSLFKNFLKRCLEKDINKRISVEDALNHPWMISTEKIFDEREKMSDVEKFLIMLVTDNINSFNQVLKSFNYSSL